MYRNGVLKFIAWTFQGSAEIIGPIKLTDHIGGHEECALLFPEARDVQVDHEERSYHQVMGHDVSRPSEVTYTALAEKDGQGIWSGANVQLVSDRKHEQNMRAP